MEPGMTLPVLLWGDVRLGIVHKRYHGDVGANLVLFPIKRMAGHAGNRGDVVFGAVTLPDISDATHTAPVDD